MAKLKSETVAIFAFQKGQGANAVIDVDYCFSTDNPDNGFYDLFNSEGQHINEGNPLFERPSAEDVFKIVKEWETGA